MKVGEIEIPRQLLEAIRTQTLVIFAGAGVSVAEPSRLPNFSDLETLIAKGSGFSKDSEENIVQFLGRIESEGVNIRARTHDHLKINSRGKTPKPSSLHYDILSLFGDLDSVRLVTTNFDDLFEKASCELFEANPEIFRAPALPLGKQICGIVHLHGSLKQISGLILTDADFGRAYLTEGWATRFLVDLYQHYSVLFVGYGHNDPIVDYLARALPRNDHVYRYALISGDKSGESNRWRWFGIEPIVYPNEDGKHSVLADGLSRLAKYVSSGVLDWQRDLTRIAHNGPPLNPDDTSTVDFALSDVVKTRLFVNAASKSEWVDWFDRKGLFCNLFKEADLSEMDKIFSNWLMNRFTTGFSEDIFRLIQQYNCNLNRRVWLNLTRHACNFNDCSHKGLILLLRTLPVNPDTQELDALVSLGNVCSRTRNLDCLVDILAVCANAHLDLLRRTAWMDQKVYDLGFNSFYDEFWKYSLNEFWKQKLRHHIHMYSRDLMSLSINYLYEHHRIVAFANESSNLAYETSFLRRAIEDHEQNSTRRTIDIFIDVCRDSFQSMLANEPELTEYWCIFLISADSPLLNRLGIHAIMQCSHVNPNQRMDWIFDHLKIHDLLLHHEMFVAVKSLYPKLNIRLRKRVISSIKKSKLNENQKLTAHAHFNWFYMLTESAPSCAIAKRALKKIEDAYPEFQSSEHPEFDSYYTYPRQFAPQNELLLERLGSEPIEDWIEELVSGEGTHLDQTDFSGILAILRQRANANIRWSSELANSLISREIFDVALWEMLVDVWTRRQLEPDQLVTIQEILSQDRILGLIPRDAAKFLAELDTKYIQYDSNGWSPVYMIAHKLWNIHNPEEDYTPGRGVGVLTQAMNHPSGGITQFWINQISELHQRKKVRV